MSHPHPVSQTVVVVDDDPDVRDALTDLLTSAGYQVVAISRGEAALAHLCQNPPPAAVLVDLLMPGMNAWELLAEMRRRESLSRVPFIAMTGARKEWGSPVPEEMMVRKPIDEARLLQLIGSMPPG